MPDLNFLITTWEGGGSVGPMLTLARKLRDAGHGVRVMSDACNRRETEALNLRFVPWTRAPSRTDRSRQSEIIRDWAADNPLEGFRQAIEDLFAGPAYAYAEDVIEELRHEPADLVVTSDFLFGVLAGCESIGQPVAAMTCNSVVFPLDDAPVAGPTRDETMSAAEAAQAETMREAARAAFDCGLPALNAARARLGLGPLPSLLDQLSYATTILVAVSRYFDMVRNPIPSRYSYVGPQLDEVAWAEQLAVRPDERNRPLVVVSFSTTFQNHVGVLQRVIDGLASLPVDVIVTLGPAIERDELQPAQNCSLVASAQHGPLMRQASLVVTHGGHGTLARAMTHKLPLLVIPHGRDQDGNAARVEAHGAGIMLPPAASAAQIHDAAVRLLSEPAFAAAAARLAEAVTLEADESHIVGEIERLCSSALTSMAG